jgi:capsular exopolysaccharide synthesis family protein
MSRIDEVLRQVETGTDAERSERRTSLDPAALDRYRPEALAAIEPRRSHAPLTLPLLGKADAAPRRPREASYPIESLANTKLVIDDDTAPVMREQYRRLAASLHGLQVERGLKTLVVTSAMPDDGKTLTAANLALTLSESYARRVLLIDADLREPSLANLFGVANTAGLTEAIQFPSRPPAMVEVSPTLTVLPGGRQNTNPLATVSSQRMRTLLEELSRQFDWVLLDVPPVGLLPDGLILAHLTGACVLVIRAGVTPYAAVERAVSALGRDCIIGTVLNGVDENAFTQMSYTGYK